jgi:1-acyl-sn-glycerol-3-phosphate acyltransferase
LKKDKAAVVYPRKKVIRTILTTGINVALFLLGKIRIVGKENLPQSGPLIVVGNHFSFLDPLALIKLFSWKLEFLGGTRAPNAPKIVDWFRWVWGIIPVFRGSVSRDTFALSESVLKQGGMLAIFPEGGNWATVLRPARPGVAFLAARTGAEILPIGLDGFDTFFSNIRKFQRPVATINIGAPVGPFEIDLKDRANRDQLNRIGHEIMLEIAALIPPEKRGYYSDDEAIREAARGTEVYPWENVQES